VNVYSVKNHDFNFFSLAKYNSRSRIQIGEIKIGYYNVDLNCNNSSDRSLQNPETSYYNAYLNCNNNNYNAYLNCINNSYNNYNAYLNAYLNCNNNNYNAYLNCNNDSYRPLQNSKSCTIDKGNHAIITETA